MSRLDKPYYFWLLDKVVGDDEAEDYSAVFDYLYNREFETDDEFDENLFAHIDGLRDRFFAEKPPTMRRWAEEDNWSPRCYSILELMVYLAVAAEETFMSDYEYGDRKPVWFRHMMASLGLRKYYNKRWNPTEVEAIIDDFLDKKYEADGTGGLFKVSKSVKKDMRSMNLWLQLNTFLIDYCDQNGEN